jgi:hypothetical protein
MPQYSVVTTRALRALSSSGGATRRWMKRITT